MGVHNQSSSTESRQCSGEMSKISLMMTMLKPLCLLSLHV